MRRPVKPFVTEYKGPNRRPGHPAGAVQRQSDEFFFATFPAEVSARPAADAARHNPEDAYEAALRAADALFSPTEKAPTAAESIARTDPTAEDQPSLAGESPDHAAPGHGGRILRAIDEPPVPGLAELEAERAPKRRGRKPGSKNKPKAPVFLDDAPRVAPPRPAGEIPTFAFLDLDVDAPRSSPAATVARAQAAPEGATYRARNDKRFSWVRTKLKPGEEWKRRLPKVCW